MIVMGLKVVQVGGNESRDVTTNLSGVEDWRGKTNLRQWLSMIANCDGILSAPSGIMHASSVWNKPMVIICGAREIPEITAYPTAQYVVSDCENKGCEAAYSNQCIHFDKFCQCMNIASDVVIDALNKVRNK